MKCELEVGSELEDIIIHNTYAANNIEHSLYPVTAETHWKLEAGS